MLARRVFLGVAAAGALVAAGFVAVGGDANGVVTTAAFASERQAFDRAAFNAALQAGGPVLVDVAASWCSTCKRQEEIVGELVQQPEFEDFKIFVVDYDTQKSIMREFGAQQRSTLIAFKDAIEVGRLVGDTRPMVIEALLSQAI